MSEHSSIYQDKLRSNELVTGATDLFWVGLPRRRKDANNTERHLKIGEDLTFPIEGVEVIRLKDYYTDRSAFDIVVLEYPIAENIRKTRSTVMLAELQ